MNDDLLDLVGSCHQAFSFHTILPPSLKHSVIRIKLADDPVNAQNHYKTYYRLIESGSRSHTDAVELRQHPVDICVDRLSHFKSMPEFIGTW